MGRTLNSYDVKWAEPIRWDCGSAGIIIVIAGYAGEPVPYEAVMALLDQQRVKAQAGRTLIGEPSLSYGPLKAGPISGCFMVVSMLVQADSDGP